MTYSRTLNLSQTALLLSEVQSDAISRFPEWTQAEYIDTIDGLLEAFRSEIEAAERAGAEDGPVVIHHVASCTSPHSSIPAELLPSRSSSEFILAKSHAGSACFADSNVLQLLRARGISTVVLAGLTTSGSILGSCRVAEKMGLHVVVPREAVADAFCDVQKVLVEEVLPRMVEVVGVGELVEGR